MKYKITTSYNWYKTNIDTFIIKTYHINNIPFTFDELDPLIQDELEIINQANQQLIYTPIDFYNSSFYLIDEQCHPMLFELDLENPEILKELDS